MADTATVQVVHCIDTEGPLYESVDATFERLRGIFGLELEPSRATLAALQAGEVDLGGIEADVQRVVNPHLLAYNDTWDKVDAMLEECLSTAYRDRVPDSFGGGWVYSWFCVDHVDYDANPRRRDMGYHNVFDHYRAVLRESDSSQDGLHFHYHPHAFSRQAHRCATHWWAASDSLFQTLSRRVIDRGWFPAVHRPGFHVIRPESHWFLEQFIPFDYSNQAILPDEDVGAASDLGGGRFGDWRRAPAVWQPYHPAHDDYQVPGGCRRWTARCLNVGTRYRLLAERDVRQAFAEAREGKPVVLAVTDHDFRDMRSDVDGVRELVSRVAAEFPGVPFRYSEALQAMRDALGLPAQPPCELDLTLSSSGDGKHVVEVRSVTPTFGPQPWLALKTTAGTYHFDDLDIGVPFHKWQYVLDEETFPLRALEVLGVAASNARGTTTVARLKAATGAVARTVWHEDRPGDAR